MNPARSSIPSTPEKKLSSYEHIQLEIDGAVAALILDEPRKLNAMDVAMLREMMDAVTRINDDDAIRVAILAANGRSFCAGADLRSELGPGRTTTDHLNEDHRPVLLAIANGTKPWISAVQGAAAGIGSAYAMNCDLTIMADDAYIYQAFAAIGLIPDGGATWHLANTLGRKRAYELIATGEKLPAARCLEWGLCNRIVPAAVLLDEAHSWANELAGRAPLSLRYAKDAVRTAITSDLPRTFDREVELQKICSESEDAMEGIKAFIQKREPEFSGR
ncbi:MAG: enoyl-CoA hydratase/isomerase family protein [bacterium]|nr:enoyl-CoA hydratase [Deltaproteobacteria bacterium]MCP4906967.1 enoyl-CoA hydratase/isomerase family protein [bacterium]